MSKIYLIDIGAIGGFALPWSFHTDKIERSLSFEPNEAPILTKSKSITHRFISKIKKISNNFHPA